MIIIYNRKEYDKDYYQKNRDRILQVKKIYREKNKKIIKRKDKIRKYNKKIKRMTRISNHNGFDNLICEFPECNITNPNILSVRHINGRCKDEYYFINRIIRGSYRVKITKQIEDIKESIFYKHLKNNNYIILCMNHGHIHEYKKFSERLYSVAFLNTYTIKRYIHRLCLLGGKCSKCGENDYNYLCGHHLTDGTKDPGLSRMKENKFRELLQSNQLICICYNCHQLIHSDNGGGD